MMTDHLIKQLNRFNFPSVLNNLPFLIVNATFQSKQRKECSRIRSASISLNRQISPTMLQQGCKMYSIWSGQHLQVLNQILSRQIISRAILIKNPYKSEELIQEGFSLGVKNYVVDSIEQMHKIQKIRFEIGRGRNNPPVNFLWRLQHQCLSEDMETISRIAQHGFNIGGLNVPASQKNFGVCSVETIIKRMFDAGHKLNIVVWHQPFSTFDYLQQTWATRIQDGIQRLVDLENYSNVKQYRLIAKVIGRCKGKPVIHEAATKCLEEKDLSEAQFFCQDGKEYIVSPLSRFSFDSSLVIQNEQGTFRVKASECDQNQYSNRLQPPITF